jgi:AraC-like DNA-binding protein
VPDDSATIAELCATIVREPDRVVAASVVRVGAGIDIAAHSHDDLCQFDWASGCAGAWTVDGRTLTPVGDTALVFLPGTAHGYRIRPQRPDAVVINFKLRVDRRIGKLLRIFRTFEGELAQSAALAGALRRMARLSAAGAGTSTLAGIAVAEALCLWPRSRTQSAVTAYAALADERLEAALRHIDVHLTERIDVAELARSVHVSPRHLSRLFERMCGRSPAAFIAGLRLDRARQLLAEGWRPSEIASALGFSDLADFSRWFRRLVGASPSRYASRDQRL